MSRRIRQTSVILSVAVVVVIFFLGVREMVPWDYATGAIMVAGVIAAIIKFYPSKTKSEKKEVEAPIQKGEMIKTEEPHDKAEIVPLKEKEQKRKSVLLPEGADFTSLSINNDFLNQLYEQAYRQAITKYHDAELGPFVLYVYPFVTAVARVEISFYFVSKSAQRQCRFDFDDKDQQIRYVPPDSFVKKDQQKNVFSTLPWNKSPHWLQFLKQMYVRISPLSQVGTTRCSLHVLPRQEDHIIWLLKFTDGFQGKEYDYEWNGKEIDDNNIKSS